MGGGPVCFSVCVREPGGQAPALCVPWAMPRCVGLCVRTMHSPDYRTAVWTGLVRRPLLGCGDGAVGKSACQESITTGILNLQYPHEDVHGRAQL